MTRGNNRHQIFHQPEDYRYYLMLVQKYKQTFPFQLYHYCLMPNHTHFLIKTEDGKTFSQFMKGLNLAYSTYYKHRYGWIGYFWQGRFKCQAIANDRHFLECGKYIELNPVRGGLVADPVAYAYSSYNYYAHGAPDPLVSTDPYYAGLTLTVNEIQRVYQQMIVSQLVKDSYKKEIWGRGAAVYNEQRKATYAQNSKSIKRT